MNVNSMRYNRERDSSRPLREVRDGREIHMSRDNVVGAVAENGGEASGSEANSLEITPRAGSVQLHSFEYVRAVGLSRQSHVVPSRAESQRKLAAEGGDPAAEPLEARRPDVNLQVTPRTS